MPRLREILAGPNELAKEFEAINVDPVGAAIMVPKGEYHILRARNLKSPAANILKQELLSLGADCATSRTVILGDKEPSDAILIATRRQLNSLVTKLKAQPFGLKGLARQIRSFIDADPAPRPIKGLCSDWAQGPLVMGIINVTPDSFSGDGMNTDAEAAATQALRMEAEGADCLDVGGESTRPGSDSVPEEEERARVIPVIEAVRAKSRIPISVDTMKASVAFAALEVGATVVNDVSGGRADPEMFSVVAQGQCPYILMHMQGLPKTMQDKPHYDNVMDELHLFFDERLDAAVQAGIGEDRILIDPGLGFGKRMEDNYEIVRRLGELKSLGRPIVVGGSRKSMLDSTLGPSPQERQSETVTLHAVAMEHGVNIIRVHEVIEACKSRLIIKRIMGLA